MDPVTRAHENRLQRRDWDAHKSSLCCKSAPCAGSGNLLQIWAQATLLRKALPSYFLAEDSFCTRVQAVRESCDCAQGTLCWCHMLENV